MFGSVGGRVRRILLGLWCGAPEDAEAGLSWLQVALGEMSAGGLPLVDVAGQNTLCASCAFAS